MKSRVVFDENIKGSQHSLHYMIKGKPAKVEWKCLAKQEDL